MSIIFIHDVLLEKNGTVPPWGRVNVESRLNFRLNIDLETFNKIIDEDIEISFKTPRCK